MKINLSWNVCRICLWESEELISIYEKDEQNQIISEKISLCGGVTIEKDLNLPDQICRKCVAFLNIAYKFHTNCQNSDKILRAFVLDLNSEANFSKSFTEYVAHENSKSETKIEVQQATSSAGDSKQTEEYKTIHTACSSDPNLAVQKIVNYDDIEEEYIQEPNDDDNDNDDWFGDDKYKYDPDYEESTTKKKKPDRRKSSKVKPTNTITLGLDGSAVIKPVQEKPIHICEVCGNKYTKKFALDNHMKWHRDEKPFACEICGKKFSINFQLTRHMRTHTGQKPYECKFCGRKFSDLSTCIKHQRTHTNERPFKCDTCGKAFNYSHVLKVHMAVHTGEKPYCCDLCGKAFAQLHHLKAHMNTLTHQRDSTEKVQRPKRQKKVKAEENPNLQSIFALLDDDQNAIRIDSD